MIAAAGCRVLTTYLVLAIIYQIDYSDLTPLFIHLHLQASLLTTMHRFGVPTISSSIIDSNYEMAF